MKHFLQHICDLVLISKPCAHSARTAPFYFPVKNARNERPLSRVPYLARPLSRVVSNQNGQVTFKYIESRTGNTLYRTLKGEDFLHLIMQHVLPKGFRRVRDYGFLHGNAKKLLSLVQLILHVVIKGIEQHPRPVFKCPCCKSPMVILGFRRTVWEPG